MLLVPPHMRSFAIALSVLGIHCLVGVIKFNRTVESLDLSNVGLVLQAAQTLAKAIAANTTLTKLDISRNPLSDVSNYSETELE